MITGQFTQRILSYLESNNKTLNQTLLDEAAKRTAAAFKRQVMQERDPKGGIRMSSGGQCVRKQWYAYKGTPQEPLSGRTINTFLMGDICETGLSVLGRLAGWKLLGKPDGEDLITLKMEVSNHRGEPPETVEIPGHPDDIMQDDEGEMLLVEYKSASEYSYRRFEKEGPDDAWGYLTQASLYMEALGLKKCVMVFMCKNTGHICDHVINKSDELVANALARWQRILGKDEMPDREFSPEAETKYNRSTKVYDPTGRSILGMNCSYCSFRSACWPNAAMELKGDKPIWLVSETQQTTMDI